jgi:uncharacterized damage-inducible protein DinB
MNADSFRQLFDYHFSENRKTWDLYITKLTQEQFIQKVDYSLGSVRNHIVHLMSVDDTWFYGLRKEEIPHMLNPVHFHKHEKIRKHWDVVEKNMREYLIKLNDDTLTEKPLDGEDKDLTVWQVLIHVVNHGTDHRSQILRILHDMGVKTTSQDYMFYVYNNL